MGISLVSRLIVAAPQGVCAKLTGLLGAAGIEPDFTCYTGEEALTAVGDDSAVLLTTWRLEDMTGEELAQRVGETAGVLMIVPQHQEIDAKACPNVLALHNPLSQDALVSAVRTMCFCAMHMRALRQRAEKLGRMLEERKIIERAKGRLMDLLQLSESEAHYRIQKKSMDSGKRIVDVAREILEEGQAAAC